MLKAARWTLLAVLLALGPAVGGCDDGPVEDQITTESGSVSGTVVAGTPALHVYKGIPYAAPPVGALRWKPPQPVTPWEGVRACTEFGPACWQPSSALGPAPALMSEDCLSLNVWTPAARRSDRLPVMVWIHGGGFVIGAGTLPGYDGAALARRGVVVVTINYRLGAFGFLAHPLLSAESERGVSGNYGLLDQVAALEWVRRNIYYFGGDPARVTIFGESAGGVSVACHLVSPLSEGLFHRAVLQSGVAMDPSPMRGAGSMEEMGGRVAGALGADTLEELRARSPEELMAASSPRVGLFGDGNAFGPCVDGWALPDRPATLMERGRQHDVPLMAGTNADEGTLFLPQLPIYGVLAYKLWLLAVFGAYADEVFALYPATTWLEVPGAVARTVTVGAFVMPTRVAVRAHEQQASPAYLYHFTRAMPLLRLMRLGATHGSEIPYVFGNLVDGYYEPVDHALSETMMGAWVRFAATGDPNEAGSSAWPAYERAADRHVEFGEPIAVGSRLHEAGCDLFEAFWRSRR